MISPARQAPPRDVLGHPAAIGQFVARSDHAVVEFGSEAGISDESYFSDRQLWLWPLPPPRPFEFVVEWPTMGIDGTTTTFDGAAMVRAADRSQPYWP